VKWTGEIEVIGRRHSARTGADSGSGRRAGLPIWEAWCQIKAPTILSRSGSRWFADSEPALEKFSGEIYHRLLAMRQEPSQASPDHGARLPPTARPMANQGGESTPISEETGHKTAVYLRQRVLAAELAGARRCSIPRTAPRSSPRGRAQARAGLIIFRFQTFPMPVRDPGGAYCPGHAP